MFNNSTTCKLTHVLYIVMWKRLRDHSLLWEDRLKVAWYIWRGMDQSRDQGKARYLYQWTSESLVTIYKKSIERYTYMYIYSDM